MTTPAILSCAPNGQPILKIKKLHPDAELPSYATDGSACFDLAAVDVYPPMGRTVQVGDPAVFRTGLAFEIPQGWVMLIFPRSGHGFNNSTRLANCIGVIDSDYRGEVRVKLTRDYCNYTGLLKVKNGNRIAQAMLVRADQWAFEMVEELSETDRGEGGFGSTGA